MSGVVKSSGWCIKYKRGAIAGRAPIKEHQTTIALDALAATIVLYTDGSWDGSRAGWGMVAVRANELHAASQPILCLERESDRTLLQAHLRGGAVLAECYGSVVIDATDPSWLGASAHTNNTAELSAIGEALRWVRDATTPTPPKHALICYDSEYAAKSVLGVFNGDKNRALIDRVRCEYDSTLAAMKQQHGDSAGISFVHVKAHNGNKWNERADALANRGRA